MDTSAALRVLIAEEVRRPRPCTSGEGARFTLVFPDYAPHAALGNYVV